MLASLKVVCDCYWQNVVKQSPFSSSKFIDTWAVKTARYSAIGVPHSDWFYFIEHQVFSWNSASWDILKKRKEKGNKTGYKHSLRLFSDEQKQQKLL